MLITADELRGIGVREDAVQVYLNSENQLGCSQKVLATLHLLNVIGPETYERRLKELFDMSSVEISVTARGADGEPQLKVSAEQYFKDKGKQLAYQEAMIGEAVAAFSKVSLELRKDEQGV